MKIDIVIDSLTPCLVKRSTGKIFDTQIVAARLTKNDCKRDNGYDYIYFEAKTSLIRYYQEKLGAQQLGKSQRMIIEGDSFINLIQSYYGGALNG